MATKYYRKELVSNRIMHDSSQVAFEILHGNRGVIAVDDEEDPRLVDFLDSAAQRHKLGVVAITKEEYDGLKKNPPKPESRPLHPLQESIRVHNPVRYRPPSPAKPVAVGETAAAVAKAAAEDSKASAPRMPAPSGAGIPAAGKQKSQPAETTAESSLETPFKPAVAPKVVDAASPEANDP